jgi:DNA-directed RNA polymerase subunit RPC12/RpoP
LGVRDQDAGRQARCTQCGELFTIGAAEAAAPPTAAKTAVEVAPAPPIPVLVSFECSLCQTRMTARTADVGKKMECPDCGRRTVIPPPPKAKAPVVPAAMSGEQYELWDAVEAPGKAPKPAALVRVECRLCETLMYAAESQIGGEIRCPDCGAMTAVKRPKPVKPRGPQQVRGGEEYQLDPESAPTERPVPMPVAIRDAQLHEHARATTVGPDGRLIVQKKAEEKRPERPRVPLIQGVWRMLVTQEIIARWVITSILLGGVAWLAVEAFSSAGIGMIAGIFILLLAVGVLVLWTVFASPSLLAVVS